METGDSVGPNVDGELCVRGPVITKVSFHDPVCHKFYAVDMWDLMQCIVATVNLRD